MEEETPLTLEEDAATRAHALVFETLSATGVTEDSIPSVINQNRDTIIRVASDIYCALLAQQGKVKY